MIEFMELQSYNKLKVIKLSLKYDELSIKFSREASDSVPYVKIGLLSKEIFFKLVFKRIADKLTA